MAIGAPVPVLPRVVLVNSDTEAENGEIAVGIGSIKTTDAIDITFGPTASGGNALARTRIKSTTSQNPTVIKAASGNLYFLTVQNNHASSAAYLKLYNKATAPDQNDVPVHTLILPPAGTLIRLDGPMFFSAGISMRITRNIADSDTANISADEVHGSISYL